MSETQLNQPDASPASNRYLPALVLLFIGSGCAALIYEIVWLQLLQLVIGLTTISLGVLLGTYMGGMCLGSFLLPRLVSSRRHPLRVYAALELGIGIIGIAVLFVMPVLERVYTSGGGSILTRCVLAAVCLLPPTLLMGATLPAISRWVETTPKGVSWLGFFYGGNIVGAVFGCLLAGFCLLRVYNMATATYVAALINAAVCLCALGLASVTSFKPKAEDATPKPQPGMAGFRSIYLAIGLSGLAALGAEVVWTRVIGLMFGATVYTFSIILAVFLVGLGLGSSIGSFLARTTQRPRLLFALCQLLLVGAVWWTGFMIYASLPYWPVDPGITQSPWYTFQLDMARSLWAVLPAPILWGASFPLALASIAPRGQDPGRLVGGVYAANTVGAILGSLCFSLILIPDIGTQNAERFLIVLPVIACVAILAPSFFSGAPASSTDLPQRPSIGPGWLAALVGAGVAAIFLAVSIQPLPWGVAAYGRFMATYRTDLAPGIIASEAMVPHGGGSPNTYCTYMGEGLNGTVAVTYRTDGVRSFHSAGKVQASNDPRDMRLQRLLGHISALAFPEPKTVLVVACGAGVTAGSFVVHPSVKRIVICDIEPLVPDKVTPMFSKENYDVVHDPRVEIVHDDGRHFIRTTKEKFDVITSDPIDPWVKGCAALNTIEYYQMCKDHLNPGGVMSLWIPLYESNPTTFKSVLATFFQVYPYGIVWSNDENNDGYDAVLFGQSDPTRIDIDKWQERLNRPDHDRVRQSLADVGFNNVVDLLSTFATQASDLKDWMADAQINTDANMRLQYLAGWSVNSYVESKVFAEITHNYKFPDNIFTGSSETRQLLEARLSIRKQPK